MASSINERDRETKRDMAEQLVDKRVKDIMHKQDRIIENNKRAKSML